MKNLLRCLVRATIIFALLIPVNPGIAQELDVLHTSGMNWMKYTDAENFLYHHIAGQAYKMLEERKENITQIKSLSGWQERQEYIKNRLFEIIGPFPEKSDLNARVTGRIKKDGYRIEHVIFESRPGFYVTGSLFIPDGIRRKKAPAVIYCSGHTVIAHRAATGTYQNLILNLVKKGFIVFAFDPVGQGERLEYFDPQLGRSVLGGSTREHSYPGAQAFITGNSQAGYMAWDGIRAVDYLISRREIDPARIGITGCSGGGTQIAYIAALDDRIKAAANQCYITNFTRLLQSIGPQDAEQNLFHGISKQIDHADFLIVRAPRPSMILSTTEDFFSIHGARETFREVSGIYRAYGKEDSFEMAEDMGPHGTTASNREAMYAFFQKHLDNPGNPAEEQVEFLTEEELQITSTGQLSTSLMGETVFSLNRKHAEELIAGLNYSRRDLEKHLPAAVEGAKKLSGFIYPEDADKPVFTGRIARDGYIIEKYFLKGEGDYVIPYLLFIPERPASRALLYLHPDGKSAEASAGGEIEWFVKNGFTVLAPDLLGIGETGPGIFRGDAFIEGISYNIWFGSILIGRSITGMRAGDISRLTKLLKRDLDFNTIFALAKMDLSPDLLHAAAFETGFAGVALINPVSSYRSIVYSRFYNPALIHGTVPGALTAYDLPDLAAALAPSRLMLLDVTDASVESLAVEYSDPDLSVIRRAYEFRNASGSLIIESGQDLQSLFMKWINN